MQVWLHGLAWFGLYVTVTLIPLGAALVAPALRPGSFQAELAVGIGFVAFGAMLVQFALVSRLKASSRPFGTDALVQFHQQIGLVIGAFAVVHAFTAPRLWSSSGVGALVALALLTVLSVWRRQLRVSYEVWQGTHLALAVGAVALTTVHMLALGRYSARPPLRAVVIGYAAAFVAQTVRYRLLRPFRLARQPWLVDDVRAIGGETTMLRLRPAGQHRLRFLPGQFAWLITGSTPFWSEQHPLSIASSAEHDDVIEFAVKALGDWSRDVVPSLGVGSRVWVDGAFGAFTIDRAPVQGFVMIAGGIGIAPFRSMLLTMRDRGDRREVRLIYAVPTRAATLFNAELEELQQDLNLEVIPVLDQPSEHWQGEHGRIDAAILTRHLPACAHRFGYLVCGPPPMVATVETALVLLGVPAGAINTERFTMV